MALLPRLGGFVSEFVGRDTRMIRALRPTYESLLDLWSGGRGVEWKVNSEFLRIDPHVRRLIPSVGEASLWNWLKETVRVDDQILDIGSFLGVYAVFLARWAGPNGRVLAFEPTIATYQTLQHHLAINDLAGRIKAFQVALGNADGEVELREHSEPYRNSIAFSDPSGTATSTSAVRLTTVDAVCKREAFHPTLLRMDVQGFERSVLLGARETIARCRGRLRMVVEVHPQLWGLHGFGPSDFDRTLAELGLRARPLEHGNAKYEPDSHIELEYV